jgi:hypothetical protein
VTRAKGTAAGPASGRFTALALIAALALQAALAASCAHRDAGLSPTSGAGRAEPDDLLPRRVIDDIVRETERTRQLAMLEPVEAVTMTQDEIRALVRREIAETDMAQAERIMRAFGFIPPGLDLEAQLVDLYSEEVLGMYDPHLDRLIVLRSVASDLDGSTEEALNARMVLSHEITHALQDQHFHTLDRAGEEAWSDDAESVLSCLAEGDATLTMFVAAVAAATPVDPTLSPGFRQMLRAQGDAVLPQSEALTGAPPYFGHVLAAIYLEGAAFTAELRRLGGWRAVDEAHRRPPRATRDVLHTAAYLTGRRIIEIDLPDEMPGLDGAGWERVAEATLGELETGAYLLALADATRARAAAAGWAGDRFAVHRSREGDRLALTWRLSFESDGEAAEFVEAAREAELAAGRGPCAGNAGQQASLACAEGRDALALRGADVVVLRDVPPGSAAQIVEALFAAPATPAEVEPPQPELLARWRAEEQRRAGELDPGAGPAEQGEE